MAKLSSINKNERRKKLVKKYAGQYARLKAIADDESRDDTERLIARLKLAEIPRNANPTRVRNRCEITGRSRAYYRKFRLSRIMLRELANKGPIPGVTCSPASATASRPARTAWFPPLPSCARASSTCSSARATSAATARKRSATTSACASS